MGVSDVVVRNLMTVYLVVITAVKAPVLVSGQEFSGVFVLVIATAVVGVILIASIIWDFVEKRAKHWWHLMITRVLKLVEGVSVGMALLYGHLTSDSGFLNINFVPTTRMKSMNPFVVLFWVFFLSFSSSTSPTISVAALDVEPNTPYYIITFLSDNTTCGLYLEEHYPRLALDLNQWNGVPFKFSPVNNNVKKILNDTDVKFSTDGKDVGIFGHKDVHVDNDTWVWWLATTTYKQNQVFDATFRIKKGDDDKFSLVYTGDKSSKECHVNTERNGFLLLGDSANCLYFELLAA